MDPRIENLETTTFLGKRLTRRQIAVMQETVELFPNDSRRELAEWRELVDRYHPRGCRSPIGCHLAFVQAEAVAETVARIVDDIAAFWQRERPGRSYPRMSLKPARKWTRKGKASTTT